MTMREDDAMIEDQTGPLDPTDGPAPGSPEADAAPPDEVDALAAIEAARDEAGGELAEIQRYALDLERRYAAAIGSPSWRLLEPVRSASRLVRRRSPPRRVELRLSSGTWRARSLAEAQKAEVARLAHHLWGGLSGPAGRALARIAGDAAYGDDTRAEAIQKLATWQAFDADFAAALATLRGLDALPEGLRGSATRRMKEGYILLAQGDKAGARRAFERILGRWPRRGTDPDAALALTNCLGGDAARLRGINGVLTRAGLAPLRLRRADRPLGLDNIRAVAPRAELAGMGRVSIVMPAHNAAGTIEAALRSLMEQSFRDLEIIVVDDASSDGTVAAVEALAREDARILLLRQERNAGAYPARNRGLEAATGAFVTTHDADDWSHPQKIERQLAALAAAPDLAAVCCNWVRVSPDLGMTSNWRVGRRIIFFSHSSLLFRREMLELLGGWDPVRIGADTDVFRRIRALRGEKSIRTILSAAPLAFARDDTTSLTRTRATHVRTVHFGLRQIYHAVSRAIPAGDGGPMDFRARHAALPPEMFGRTEGPAEVDFLLMGDCTRRSVIAAMRDEALGHAGRSVGVFHWPDLDAAPADLHPDYAALLGIAGVRAILPGAQLRLAARYPTFFGWDHQEVDQPPEIVA